jgi:hypothetical protein
MDKIKKKPNSSVTAPSESSNHAADTDDGNDIPYVPATDRTNLNETTAHDLNPVIPPLTKTNDA